MRDVPLHALEDKIIRPGFEKHLTPLLMYRGSLTLGRAHRLWNLCVSAMLHEATVSDVTQRLTMNPTYSQLCGPESKVSFMAVRSFAGRLLDNPSVMAEMPGLRGYIRELLPPHKAAFFLERVSETTHRSRNVGAGGWRTFVDGRLIDPMPKGFTEAAPGKSLRWARREYQQSYYTVKRWFSEAGIEPSNGNLRDVPENWRLHARTERNQQLQSRYGVSYSVIRRWREETDIYPDAKVTVTKPGRAPVAVPLAYPFLIHEGRRPGHRLLRLVNDAVPRHLDPETRADICQDLMVGILAGDFSEDDLFLPVAEMTRRVLRMFPTKYGPVSLDDVIPGTNIKRIDTLTEEDSLWSRI